MWNRRTLKTRAKAAYKRNYWNCVLVALLIAIVMGAAAGRSVNQNSGSNDVTNQVVNISVSVSGAGLGLLLHIFAQNPLAVGGKKFFANNARGKANLNDVLGGFTGSYIRNVLALFLRELLVFLWTLLLIIPGIVKAYSYRMVPYILADNPDMEAKAVLDLSSQMMKGSKWKAFMLDLSFLGWHILSILTLGLLEIFKVMPYVDATDAELYLALRDGGNTES